MIRTSSFYNPTQLQARHLHRLVSISMCTVMAFACVLVARHSIPMENGVHHGWANFLDRSIEMHLNRFANRWPMFDSLMLQFAERNLLKGAPIVFLCWAAFFKKADAGESPDNNRAKLVSVVPLAIASVVSARILAKILPFRERPFRAEALHFQLPHGMSTLRLYSWSSFPSDHAVLFTALAVGVFYVSRRMGLLAFMYVALFIMGPRMYLGIHWPIDLLAGAAMGIVFAAAANIRPYREFVWRWAQKAWQFSPGIVAASIFLLSYEITVLFDGPISLLTLLIKHGHS
jgi:undecaprenyl-diphosphatase